MKTANIQLAGSILTRDAINYPNRDQQFTNCFSYAVGDEITGGRRIYVEKRRGFNASQVAASAVAQRGACLWQSNTTPQLAFSYMKSTGTETQIYNELFAQIGGDIANTNSCFGLTDTSISGTGNLVGIFRDSGTSALEGWYFPQGGAWTQITDGDFPPNQGTPIPLAPASPPVAMDGYMFWMCTNGQIWNSDLNSVSAYSLNNFITAQSMPDGAVGVGRSKGLIIAFGTSSIEFFRNAGNPTGSPLSSVPDSVTRIGATSTCIKTLGDAIYFQGIEADSGNRQIYQIINGQIKKISTPDIEQYLAPTTDASPKNAICYGAIKYSGYEHIIFGIGDTGSATPYAFCTTNNRWWKLDIATSMKIVAALSLGTVKSYAAGDARLSTIDTTQNVFQDNGTNVAMTIQTQPLDFGTGKYKYPAQVRLFGDKQSSTCNVAMSYSDDDAITFSTPVNMDMSTNSPAVFNPLGRFRRRVWKFTNAVNVPLRLERFEVDYEVGLT